MLLNPNVLEAVDVVIFYHSDCMLIDGTGNDLKALFLIGHGTDPVTCELTQFKQPI